MNRSTYISVSVVVPFFNEENTLIPLHDKLVEAFTFLDKSFELIFVDDGSTDDSVRCLGESQNFGKDSRILRLRKHYGKSAALAAGFDACHGKIVFTIDADLQDDPNEIIRFLGKIDEGYDVVVGYKRDRKDSWHKVWLSRMFNLFVQLLVGLRIHDVNCGFKCFRREVIDEIVVYGELHRFIPVLAHMRGFRIAEIPVRHHPRAHGTSKYGISRLSRGMADLLMVTFLFHYRWRPGHFFASLGLAVGGLGFLACLYLTILWFSNQGPIGTRPLLALAVMLILMGCQLLGFGFLAELGTLKSMRIYKPYDLDIIISGKGPCPPEMDARNPTTRPDPGPA